MSFGVSSNCVCVCLFDVCNLLCCGCNVDIGFYYRGVVGEMIDAFGSNVCGECC